MGWLRRLRNTIGSETNRDFDDEARFHLEERTTEYIQRGMTAEDARREALRRFGNVTLMMERTRDADTVRWLHDIRQDLSYTLRLLRRSPGFTAAAVLSLALGIGANTSIFTIVDALQFTKLSVEDPERLATTFRTNHLNGLPAEWRPSRMRRPHSSSSGTTSSWMERKTGRTPLKYASGWFRATISPSSACMHCVAARSRRRRIGLAIRARSP